jgi:LPXTG-motif cell wall-anchored protein
MLQLAVSVKGKELTMTTRHVRSAIAVSLVTFGVVALAPAVARAQNATDIPEKGGAITLVGCFVRGQVKSHDKYVLVRPIVGSVESVPDASCSSTAGDQVVKLQDLSQAGLDHVMLGRWLEITGRLEGNHRSDAIREVHVKSFRPVPVVPPRVAENVSPEPPAAIETPPVAPFAEAVVEEAPVATAGVREELPQTATSLPLFGLIGLVALSAGFGLHLLNRLRTDGE